MFKDLKKERELIDRELKVYRNEKFLEGDKIIEEYRVKRQSEIQELAKQCAEQMGQYEHTFHSTKEHRGIELARLESKEEAIKVKIEALEQVVSARGEVIKADDNLLKSKDNEIKRLNDIINLLINKQPQQVSTIQQIK